ncbi:MAG: hypothetical protein H6698_10070 [Myxococcales bacterium]|nr:hypothetical protein [Myxococcales bacterium]MCB9519765.1 hypothetical protein [Myxococcales bacterium]MCB9530456.1 hypothetical protein [Myxococcales bacterium]MCB9534629.1 hypothetical protein [Myxococcales bacterium]
MRRSGILRALIYVSLGGAAVSCGGGSAVAPPSVGGRPEPRASASTDFPSRSELERLLGSANAREDVEAAEIADLDEWTMVGTLPTHIGATPAAPADGPLLAVRAMVGTELPPDDETAQLDCVAAQSVELRARFGDRDFPADIAEFVTGRCGSSGVHGSRSAWIDFDGAAPSPEDIQRVGDLLVQGIRESELGRSQGGWGVATHVDASAGRFYVLVQYALRPELVEPTPIAVAGDSVEIAGMLDQRWSELDAWVTIGDHDVARCAVDPAPVSPAYRIVCPLDRSDDRANIQLYDHRPGELLAQGVLSVTVSPSGSPQSAYRRDAANGDIRGTDDASIVAAINAARAAAELPPVTLAVAQSVTVSRAAALLVHPDDALRDRVQRGVLAGWDVEGRVADVGMTVQPISGLHSASEFVSAAALSAGARSLIFGSQFDSVAIGVGREAGVTELAIVGYSTLAESDVNAAHIEVEDLVALRRSACGVGPAGPMSAAVAAVLGRQAAALDRSGRLPSPADVVDAVREHIDTGFQTYVATASDVEHLLIPDDVLCAPALEFALELAPYRPDDSPHWGLAALWVFVASGGSDVVATAAPAGARE